MAAFRQLYFPANITICSGPHNLISKKGDHSEIFNRKVILSAFLSLTSENLNHYMWPLFSHLLIRKAAKSAKHNILGLSHDWKRRTWFVLNRALNSE